ncbi:MAG: DUF4342 domain-containing protein [Anaerolineae bacterium]
MSQEHTRQEEFRIDGEEIKDKVREAFQSHPTETREVHVSGDQLVAKVKEIVHEGNIRRITIKNSQGTPILDVPLTLGVAGALILPVWAAIGAITALALDYTISVEKSVE